MSRFEWGARTYIMGIINLTPDSFSGDGLLAAGVAAAVQQARHFVAEGADILDVGGESTRPGSQPISAEEELARVVPVIQALRAELPEVVISVDSYRAEVAQASLAAGANWVNDVWGLRMDSKMARVVAEANCPVVLMHNRSKPKDVVQEAQLGGRYVGVTYGNLIEECCQELLESVAIGLAAGVRPENIILDPGVGFGKTVEQNWQLVNELAQFKKLGFPLLLGTSRKSFIGYTLNRPPEKRLAGTAATVAIGIARGADIIRVHDVAFMTEVARMSDVMVRKGAGGV